MGTSRPYYLSEFCNTIIDLKPKKILDIGPGNGKNGFLCREFGDIWNHNYKRNNWKVQIDCIEIFPEYINDIHKNIYNTIYIGDAFQLIDTLEEYDLIVATDVIEHLERDRAEIFFDKIMSKSKNFYATIPKNVGKRGGMKSNGLTYNKYEAHLSGEWSEEQLSKYGNVKLFYNHTWRISDIKNLLDS